MKKWTNAEVVVLDLNETNCWPPKKPHRPIVIVTPPTPDQPVVEETVVEEPIVEEIVNSKS